MDSEKSIIEKSIENVVCPSTVENIFPTNQTPRCARILQKQHTAKTHKTKFFRKKCNSSRSSFQAQIPFIIYKNDQ
jgi:hypothetical protein